MKQRTQVEQDASQAWIYAANCLLYENDPGPAVLNVGSFDEPRMVPRSQAWQHAYALNVLVDCDGDHARLLAAAQHCRDDANRESGLSAQRVRKLVRAADLCEQAARMVEQAGAVHDDKARRRLVAACKHETMVIALGVVPGVAEDSAQDLLDQLAEIDAEPDPLPEEARQAARHLAGQAHMVGREGGPQPWRAFLGWISRGRFGRRRGWPAIPLLGTPWQDTVSAERTDWRTRAAKLGSESAFAVDYRICRRCQLGWVEHPYTMPEYQRCGLASAALTQLRAEHPGLSWHTLGGHFRESRPFWAAVGQGVRGGYQQRELCRHVTPG
ncbi:hypothetical protein [Nonomuraea sp. NPDC050202]|uniref:hypothetical protein n=1 Tax=Nonomuraea sp. NPDC050202 TaxID=3155035 RepID=UPI0033DD31BD